MDARRAHSLLAALLADPHLLASRRIRASQTTEGEQFELSSVRLFAGQVNKVRHNDLRQILPLTFRAMNTTKLSIRIFADYSATAASLRSSGAKSTSEKSVSFYNFLDRWLDKNLETHSLIWDIIRHEIAVAQVEDSLTKGEQGSKPASARLTDRFAPAPRGRLILHELSREPMALARALRTGAMSANDVPFGRHLIGYWGDAETSSVRVAVLDDLSFALLRLSDGKATISDMSRELRSTGLNLTSKNLHAPLRQLMELGALTSIPSKSG